MGGRHSKDMATERLMIGSSPWGEECAQSLDPNYAVKASQECNAYRNQLQRVYTEAHEGCELPCRLVIKANPHDFGTYYTVDAVFDSEDEAAVKAAYWLEAEGPELWDETARAELGLLPPVKEPSCDESTN